MLGCTGAKATCLKGGGDQPLHATHWVLKKIARAVVMSADELARLMGRVGLQQVSISGMFLNPVTGRWSLMNDTAVNYITYFRKNNTMPSQLEHG